jgi:hypothetical protein
MAKTVNARATAWIVGHDTGTSSKTIWSVFQKVTPDYASPPSDPSDFGRCYRLLQLIPEWRPMLTHVSQEYKEWIALVEHWDELTALYEQELPGGTCPKLYARMRTLIDEGRIAAGWKNTGPGSWEGPEGSVVSLGNGISFRSRKR